MTDEFKKSNIAIMQTPWIWRAALRRCDLPASALRVGLALIDEFANRENGALFPSFEAIATATGLPVRTVRAGVDALRANGLIHTSKSRFDGSLDYFLLIRSDTNLSVRNAPEVTDSCHTKGQKSVARSDINLSVEGAEICHLTLEHNLGSEPENITSRRVRGPADDAFGGLRSASTLSSLRSDSSASVDGPPSTETDRDDDPIPLPATYVEQSNFIVEMNGRRNAEAATAILERWSADRTITRRIAREIVEKYEAKRSAS
ncbi:helix-turn-helix domain-containing protein [Agrobacterium sp. OT33]|uniref:helix-turn-helix domain-containing protein n=1 Tax=Agrobacterium sp. OT33 TaxID=2815338 RepID=UPI001A8E24F5|nr:helix-turn-helix domain-containing protein [Agrobacterium sp. OT33]MBO0125102.1 helix-turn-helix domain-containing protein [Agrobacterium sp. OT33]